MAPSTVTGHLLARSLSHGGIAGAVVGSVVGATLIFLLILPFVLRCIREHRYRKEIAQENAEMGITSHYGAPGEPYRPPYFAPAAGQGPSGPPTHTSGDATATLGDNNSSDDGKASSASPPSPSVPASGAPVKDQPTQEPPGADAPAVPPPAAVRSSADTVGGPASGPAPTPAAPVNPAPQQQNAQRPQTPPRKLYPAHTFPILQSQEPIPRMTARQRSSTARSARHSSSLSQSLEGFFGGRLLRQGSNRSAPTRSPTMRSTRGPSQMSRSPVEIDFDNLDPTNHHTWLMRQQGIEDYSTGVDPSFFEVDYQHLTGASAEYYSGAPLSPPTDLSSSFMAPVSFAPTPPSAIASSIASMAGAAGIAGVAGGSKRQPKPLVSRTDSMRTTATGTDFSPLPLSPTSPLPKVHEKFEGDDQARGIEDGPASVSRGMPIATALTPESAETMQRTPSYGGLVPSPQLPAPGTVNPMDVWAPATEHERFTYKTAELDRIEHSPQPVRSQSGSVSATDMGSRESSSSPYPNEFLVDDVEDEAKVTAITSQPTPSSQSPPDEEAVAIPSQTEVVVVESPEAEIKREEISQPATPAAPQESISEVQTSEDIASTKTETTAIQPEPIDLEELMGDDFQGGINFAYGDSLSYNDFTQGAQQAEDNTSNDATAPAPAPAPATTTAPYSTQVKTEPVITAPAPQAVPQAVPQTGPQQTDATYWPAHGEVNGQMTLMSGTMPASMPPAMPNMVQNTMPNMHDMSNMSNMNMPNVHNMPSSMPPMHPMPHQMPTTMPPNGHISSISEQYLMPGQPTDYSNGMLLAAPYTAPNNGFMPMNNIGGMHPGSFDNGMPVQHYSIHTPQSSPGQYVGHPHHHQQQYQQQYMNGNAAHYPQQPQQQMGLPLTPPPKGMNNFNSPLMVPGYEGPNGSASPASNQGSTPRHGSSLSPRVHTCEECGRVFDQVHKLNHHKRYHERPHECVVANCGMRFGTKTHLDRHVNDKHSKSRKYHCTEDGCPYSLPGGKSFPRKDNWRRHMINKHGVQPDHDPIEIVDQPMVGA